METGLGDLRSLVIVAVFGVVAAFVYAREPGPVADTNVPAVPAVSVPAGQPVYPPGGPPGMVYDPANNSWHYPPTTPHK
jgi:hypothetical protein